MDENLRHSGIDIIDDIPWGTHFCQFYENKEDLIDILVPYFKTGLENNEFCMWVTSQPLEVEDAKEALRKAVPDIDVYLEKGQLEIISYYHWYVKDGVFDSDRVLNGWVEKLNKALANGYDGLRLTGNTFWLEKEDWNDFVDYEKKVDSIIGNYQMIALCTYNLDSCNATEIIDAAINHQFALIKKKGKWEQMESSKRKETEQAATLQSSCLQESQAKLETALVSMTDAVFISDTQGNFTNFNDAFATFHKFKNKDECSKIFAEYPDILDVFMADGTSAPVDMWAVHRALRGETGTDVAYTLRRKDTGETWIGSYSFAPIYDKDSAIVGSIVIARDITEQKRTDYEREMMVEFLQLVNNSEGTIDMVHSAINFFHEHSGFEAVGVRLKDGEDYPYFETRGFSNEFVIMENSLCVKDATGQVICDSGGYPIHECMCGNVICGRFDSSKPFFTARGSFCTNCTTELLATTTDADRPASTRNRCNGEGYESVALIALRVGDEKLGLLQLNDRRKGRFTPKIILMWERLADYLAVALAKLQAEESLRIAHENLQLQSEELQIQSEEIQSQNEELHVQSEELRETYKTLQESEERFRTMANTIPQLIWIAKSDGFRYWYNERWYSYTGTTPEQMEGFGWQSVHDPVMLPTVLTQLKASLATGQMFDMEIHLRGADGIFRPFLTRILPLKDAAGNILHWFGTNTDITDFKRAEQVLLESEACLRITEHVEAERRLLLNMLETLPIMICLLTSDYHVAFVNRNYREHFGDSVGRYCYEYRFGFTNQCEFCESYKVLATGKPHHWEYNGMDGRVIDTYDFPFTDVDGSSMILKMGIDITEHIKAEEKIRNLANIVESSEDAIITKSLDGIITSWNQGAENIYGYLAEEVSGKNVSILEPDDLKGETKQLIEMIKQGKTIKHYETLRLKKDGTIINTSVTTSPILDMFGDIVALSTIARDITEHRRAEEQIRLSNIYNRSLIEASLDPLVTIGYDGKIIDVNESTEQVTGYSRDELIGTDFINYFTEPEKAKKGYKEVFQKGVVLDYELEIQHKNGHITPVLYNASVYKNEFGKVIGVFAAARDITERKRIEMELESIARLPMENPNPVIRLNQGHIITYSNSAAQMLLTDWGCVTSQEVPTTITDLAVTALE